MPFKNGGITATTVEEFQKCEKWLEDLNAMIQTMNGKEVAVNIVRCIIGGGIIITPTRLGRIEGLRVIPPADNSDGFWVDYEPGKKRVSIRTKEAIYIINLEAEEVSGS
jgi:hypothetical protein